MCSDTGRKIFSAASAPNLHPEAIFMLDTK